MLTLTHSNLFSTVLLSFSFCINFCINRQQQVFLSSAAFPSCPQVKLNWMNGQHLRALPEEQLLPLLTERLVAGGLVRDAASPFVAAAVRLLKTSLVRGGAGCRVLINCVLRDIGGSSC